MVRAGSAGKGRGDRLLSGLFAAVPPCQGSSSPLAAVLSKVSHVARDGRALFPDRWGKVHDLGLHARDPAIGRDRAFHWQEAVRRRALAVTITTEAVRVRVLTQAIEHARLIGPTRAFNRSVAFQRYVEASPANAGCSCLRFSAVLTKPDAEDLASRMLAETGMAVIWNAHVAAAAAHALGRLEMATALIEIAEAAERLWLTGSSVQGE